MECSLDLDEYAKSLGMSSHQMTNGCKSCWTDDYGNYSVNAEERTHEDFMDIVKNLLFMVNVTVAEGKTILGGCVANRTMAGMVVPWVPPSVQLVRQDRIEPACGYLEDFLFERPHPATAPNIVEQPNSQVLVFRRDHKFCRWSRSINWVNRLFTVPGIQEGIPGFRIEHCLFDYMHVLELGVNLYLIGAVLRLLLMVGFCWQILRNHPARYD